jgi:ABC-type amino acid transport substrate-binding protein
VAPPRRRALLPVLLPALGLLPMPTSLGAAEPAPPAGLPVLTVRFAPERDYGPFVFVDGDGVTRGLSVDLLELVRRRAALDIVVLPAAPLAQQLQAVRDGQADLLSSLRPTPERAADLVFTQPYVSVPAILLQRLRPDPSELRGPAALQALAGQPVAVGEAYAVAGFVRQRFPDVKWVTVSDDVAAFRGVSEGRFAGAVMDEASAVFVQRQERLPALRSAGPIGFEYTLSFAVPRHREDLRSRIDAALLSIAPSDRRAIVERWTRSPDEPDPVSTALQRGSVKWGLGLIALAAVGGGVLGLRAWRAAAAAERASR